jgi:hypothetical protein
MEWTAKKKPLLTVEIKFKKRKQCEQIQLTDVSRCLFGFKTDVYHLNHLIVNVIHRKKLCAKSERLFGDAENSSLVHLIFMENP